jgi:hypothetical protein
MDGRPLVECFEHALDVSRHGSSYRQPESPGETVYDSAEEAALRERLRALGYIE